MARFPAKIEKHHSAVKKPKKGLDRLPEKPGRGRPGVRRSEIRGRADNYRWIFDQVWDRMWPLLSTAQTEEDVERAFQDGASPYNSYFVPLAPLALKILHERRFPKLRHAQINFLADSLAGLGRVSPRRSRDICDDERTKEERAHHIIRYELYIECSCRYKGRSRDHACPKCGAKIDFGLGSLFGPDLM
jgi:hypothetical protein